MQKPKVQVEVLSPVFAQRRQILAFGLAAIAGRALLACSGTTATEGETGDGGTATGEGGASSEAGTLGTDGGAWATGGTASMTDAASYPNPFSGDDPTTCSMTCELTQGPCWASG
ncbi:MAG TPA: hypothetical protein VF407_09990, partial [Polyangiaceae bacterium]